jgi:hypothetical protein
MTFTRVSRSVKKGDKDNAWISKFQMTKKLNNNSEEGYKIQTARCFFFKKTDVKVGKEEALTHKVTQQEKQEAKTLKRENLESFLAKRGLALYCQRQGAL